MTRIKFNLSDPIGHIRGRKGVHNEQDTDPDHFAKTRKTKDGREFKTFFTTLPNGEKVKAKFQRDCGEPKQFPCNIDLMQDGCNLSTEKYTRTVEDNKIDPATGEVVGTEMVQEKAEAKVLWISAWAYSAEEYRDSSMDEFF